jgi:hypothetical protein
MPKPKGLPKVERSEGLPPVVDKSTPEADFDGAVDKARICPGCGREGRVVSNRLGVNVHCGPCKRHWPISNSPLQPDSPLTIPRELGKRTLVEPDWNLAYDTDVDDTW